MSIKAIDNLLNLYKGLENGFIIILKNNDNYEYKFFDISKLVKLIITAESDDKSIPNFKNIIESLVTLSLRNYINEYRDNITCVIINLNISVEHISKRSDFYGFTLWRMIHQFFYNIKSGQNGKNPPPSQPMYVFCSFLNIDSIKSKRKEAYILELEGHKFIQYPFEANVFEKLEEELKTQKYDLVCPGAYLLYSGYKLCLEKNHENKISDIVKMKITFLDDKYYEWKLVLNKIFRFKIVYLVDLKYKDLKDVIFMDFYLNENHKVEYLMNKEEVLKTTGAKSTIKIREKHLEKKIIMFTESSKIPYYKILEREAKINGWYTKQTHFGDNYEQKAGNTFFDFITALTD